MSAANDSTAIGTTATADPGAADASAYVGRFAPSPTGDLHLGSLLAAVGSFLDARHHGGRWLVRIEDLDRARVVPGSADRILRALEAFGLEWDGLVYQNRRTELYAAAADRLRAEGRTFECSCSRRELTEAGDADAGYPGTCRAGPTHEGPTATRFRVTDTDVVLFDDRIQGRCRFELASQGDFIIRRKDGVFSYQLAVVVDDAAQGVTDVVRGADLLPSCAWQTTLLRALDLPLPRYAHLPLVVAETREKLAKSRQSVAVDPAHAGPEVARVLRLLNHPPPPELEHAPPIRLLDWSTNCWNPDAVRLLRTVTVVTHPL